MVVLNYIGIGINFFLLLILISKKGKTLADFILANWLFVIGLHTIFYVLSLLPARESNIHWIIGLSAPFPLIHGPFLYLYTAASTNLFPKKKKIWLLHFIPFFVLIIILLPLYLKTANEKLLLYNSGGADYQNLNFILGIAINLSGIVYIIFSFLLLRKHKRNLGNYFSYEDRINLNWLRYLIYGILVIWIIIIVLKKSSLIFGAGVFFVTILGYLGIRQVGIFENKDAIPFESPVNESIQDQELIPKKKYANSGLTDEQSLVIHEQLKNLMQSERVYTEPELSLSILAAKLSIHPNYLSQIINEKEGQSFFDYINTLRVNEFKRLVFQKEQNNFTLISLAFDCGFNSKSSFYKNFKKITGQSPTDFIKQ